MPSQANLPMPYSTPGARLPAVSRATRTLRAAEVEVFRYQINAEVRQAKNMIDTDVLEEAVWYALNQEVRFLNDGLRLAGNSQTAQELVAQKLSFLVTNNNWRLSRDFGR